MKALFAKRNSCVCLFILVLILMVLPARAAVDLRGYSAAYPFDLQTNAANWGDAVPIQFNVANYGSDAAGAFTVGIYISPNSTFGDSDDYLVATTRYSSLASYSYSARSGTIGLPSVNPLSGQPTTVYFGMIVDYLGEVSESDEGNNKNVGNGYDLDSTPVTITPPTPDLFATDSVNPGNDSLVAFADVADDGVGNAKGTQTITLMNKGKASLVISNLTLAGDSSFALTQIASSIQNFIQPNSLPRTIAVKGTESWVLTLDFDPTSTNAQTGTLTVHSNDPDTPNLVVNLSGAGRPVPDIALTTPEAMETDFGSVVQDGVGGYSVTRTISLKNIGTGPLTVRQNGLSLLSGANYSVLSITSSTRGSLSLATSSNTIAARSTETWDVLVRFDPLAAGLLNDGLRILSDDPDESSFVASLRGHGTGPMQLVVTDSQGLPTDLTILFPNTHADGTGNESASATLTLRNTGEAPLTVASNGLTFATGAHFRLQGVVSDTQGAIALAAGPAQLAGSTSETWIATLIFDPSAAGALSDTLTIQSDNLSSPTVQVALSGEGVNRASIRVADSVAPTDDLFVGFGPALNDGVGRRAATQTLTLKNIGTQPLVISQNGLIVGGSTAFAITDIVSSARGAVNISSASDADRTIAATQAETWAVNVVFDPAANGEFTGTLQILSNDPSNAAVAVNLTGIGAVPEIMLTAPTTDLNASAGSVFDICWTDAYAAGDAQIALFLDSDTNPVSGLMAIATNISEDDVENSFAWRASESMIGGLYYVHAAIADGTVTNWSCALGRLTVDALGAFKLRSAVEVTSPDYAYEYEYNGEVYEGVTHLEMGDNVITVFPPTEGGGSAAFQFTVRLVPSLIHAETVTRDELSRVEEIKNGNGIVTRLIYDSMNRLVRRESDNGAVIQYGYDVLGRRTNMTDATGATFYEWDDLDRLTAVTTSKNGTLGDGDDVALRYEYDLAGYKTAIVYPDGERTQYTYDDAGRMLSVSNITRGLSFTYQYNTNNGLLTKLSRPNGINTFYSYDGMGRLTNLLHQKTGGELAANYGYTLDAAGKATEFRTTEPGGVQRVEQYTYDRFDRLSEVVYSDDGVVDADDKVVTYAYDGNGNRLAMTTRVNNAVTEVRLYQYGNENRLLRVTDGDGVTLAEYHYDAAGNMIQETTAGRPRFFTYDERNLVVGVMDGTNHIVYRYNGEAQRVAQIVNGQTTTFVVDGNRDVFETVQERDGNDAVSASYTFGAGRIASCEGAATEFELADRLDSVRLLTTAAGATAAACSYDVFGTAMGSAGNPGKYAFDGERLDSETGLIFLRARLYNSEVGRFLSKDPLGVVAGLNGYVYCEDDPVNRTDPQGLSDNNQLISILGEALVNTLSDIAIGNIGNSTYYGGFIPGSDRDYANVAPPGYGELALNNPQAAASQLGLNWNSWETPAQIHDLAVNYAVQNGAQGFGDLANPDIQQAHWNLAMETPYPLVTAAFGTMVGIGKAENALITVGQGIGDFAVGTVQNIVNTAGSIGSAIDNWLVPPLYGAESVGGVLIDKAAQLVGSNLSDIRGAVYDPITGQFVFLGTDGAAGVKDIDLDYLYSALQAVYGSAVPPSVTLDPPATAYTQWGDYGDGDGIFEPGEKGGFLLRYNPIWSQVDSNVDVSINAEWSGTSYQWTARFNCVAQNIINNWGKAMKLVFNSWTSSLPSGVTLNTTPWQNGVWSECCFTLTSDGQDFLGRFTMNNASTQSFIINSVRVVPGKQHRRFGGRAENTKLGWVMLEADRVMKCLSVGRDNLVTNVLYNSSTVSVPGYSNMAQRGGTGNIRMWFTPNEMTLKRHLDPDTGRASIVFDKASVALNTESFMMGLPQPAEARAFADHFTSNYDAFAAISFPCVDPNDPAGTNIVQVKIFERLREAMQAVSLARFFRDNNVPVDMWWLNSWAPPIAYSPKTTPTAYNQENGMIIYGGVQVNKPNTYVPSVTAKSVADVVQASRPDETGNPEGDIKEQIWTNSTSEGVLKAVAAQTDAEPQDGNIQLAETDLSFASPGAMSLQFTRYYQGSWLGDLKMGPGWRFTPFVLEFERPSWFDENSLMRNGTNTVWKDSSKNTRLRSGAVRVVDLRSSATLDFSSSLALGYAVDNIGNAVITVGGISSNGLPTFTPGLRQSGATLVQVSNTYSYVLTTSDGGEITFDHEGRLLQTKDSYLKTQTYSYDSLGNLTNIADMAGQALALSYDSATSRVTSVTGPAGEQVSYTYNSTGCLATATHARSGARTSYEYNLNRQLAKKILFNGLAAIDADPDLKGRAETSIDLRSNTVVSAFTQDSDGAVRTTETMDPQITDPEFEPWRKDFDREGRLLATRDATGAETTYGYDSGSLLPNVVDLPIAGRPAITIERNGYGQPTRISDPGNEGAQDVTAQYDPTTKLLLQSGDAAGRDTEWTYNENRNVARIRRQLGAQNVDTSYGYTTNGTLAAVTNAVGIKTMTIQRDALDRVTNVVDATGVSTRYEYDVLGRLWKIYDSRMTGAVEYIYDNFDRVIEIRYPVGSVFYEYDPVKGWLARQTDILGRVTRYARDMNSGDVTQVVEEVDGGVNRVTQLAYNRFGQVTNIIPPDAQAISFHYDDLGRALGSAEIDAVAPGAPQVIDSDKAKNAIWTNAATHAFTWAAPASDSGIDGYSFALDAVPDQGIDTTNALATIADATEGQHTFQVRARSRAGLWGPPAVFHLWLDRTVPSAQGATVSVARSSGGDYTVGESVSANWSGFSDTLSGLDSYYFSFTNGSGTANGNRSFTTDGTLTGPALDAINCVYVWARDRAGNIGLAATTSVFVLNPATDQDGDGMDNGAEEIAGTGADNPDELLWLNPTLCGTNGRVEVSWFAVSNRVYDLLFSTNLLCGISNSWEGIVGWTNLAGSQASMTFTGNMPTAGQQLFRVRVRNP